MAKKKKEKIDKDITKIQHRPFDTADIADISEQWMEIYSTNVNIARITPNFIDGLKPGGRRMLFAMHMNPNQGTKFRKVQIAASETITYHPHGDTSVSDVIYKFGQTWRNNICWIDKQGNYGNIRGLQPAHPRYPEAKLSKAAQYIFFSDLKYSNVPMRLGYDGEHYEPDYLPARIPTVLCNPSFSGIGIGVATNIPPFNVSEVIAATIKLIKNPKADILLVPDSPTGCDIVDNGQFKKMNDIGDDCTVTMSATYQIDYLKNIITITSIPLQQSTDAIVAKLIDMRKSGKLDGLIDIQDETNGSEVCLKLFLKSDENPDKFIEKILAKKTGLRDTFPVEIRVIDDYQPRVWGTKKLLLEWIEYRRECVRAIYNKRYADTDSEHHMNEVFLMVFNKDNINKTADIARTSKNKDEMVQRFMKEYGISSLQAKTLSGMGYSQFTKDAYEKFKEVKEKTAKEIKELEEVLSSDDGIDNVIIEQLKEADKLFGGPRKSAIIKAGKIEEKIPNTMHLIGISKDGYIKKVSLEDFKSIGSVGKTSQVMVTVINNRDNMLIFDANGRLSRVGVSALPNMEFDDIGVELSRYFTLSAEPISIINESDVNEGVGDIILVTEQGSGKRVKMSEFAKIKDFKESIILNEGDHLVAAIPAGDEDFIIYTNFGDGVRLNTTDIKYQSRTAKGLSLISLRKGEVVVGIDFLEEGCDKLLYVTSAGRLKMTDGKYLPTMNRKDEPVSLIGLDPNEYLVGVGFVSEKDRVIIYRKKSDPIEIPLDKIPITSRVAKAEKLVKTPSGDSVTGFKVIRD